MAHNLRGAVQGAELLVAGVELQDLTFLVCRCGGELAGDEVEVEEFCVLALGGGDGAVV